MLVLSQSYLRACEPDVAAAAGCIDNPDRLFIGSAGARPKGDLADFMVRPALGCRPILVAPVGH
jgi:hypothetical protein